MPLGYLIGVLVATAAVGLSLWPRPTHGPRANAAFVIASVANELPFIVLYWLLADTALAAAQGGLGTPIGAIALAISVCAVVGSAVVIGRALQARQVLGRALTALTNSGRLLPGLPSAMPRALVAPLRIPARGVRRERNIAYGPAGRENQLDVYRHRARTSGCPVLVYFHPGGFFSGRKVASHDHCSTVWPVPVGYASAQTTGGGDPVSFRTTSSTRNAPLPGCAFTRANTVPTLALSLSAAAPRVRTSAPRLR